jgi:cytochrome c-type biogenesis protein CcmH
MDRSTLSLPVVRFAAAVLAAAVLAGPNALAGQDHGARAEATALAAQLMSPFCPGRLLVDCTSSQAYALRDEIARRLAAGETPEAIRADLVRLYGAAILGAPEPRGIGLLAWILPALLAGGTALGVGWKVARAARAGAAPPRVPVASGGGAMFARLDDELRDLD